MADELTAEQRQAVTDRGGMLLVSAAAGSGKTKVLVDRLMGYLTDPADPANIDDFLIITYTKAAAAELRGKIAGKLGEYLAEHPENRHMQRQTRRLYLAKISTVHAFCTELLREYAFALELPGDFRVADENACVAMRQQAMEQVLDSAYQQGLDDPALRGFVDTQGLGRDDRLVPEIIQRVYDSARCHLDPEGWLDSCLAHLETEEVQDAARSVWGGCLLTQLHAYLDGQIAAFDRCAGLAARDPGLAKVTALLEHTAAQLRQLRCSDSWDQVNRLRNIDYGTLRFPKQVEDPELPEKIKAVRDACKKGLEKRLRAFCDPSETVLADLGQTREPTRGLITLVRAFSDAYAARKKQQRCLDFSDLEHRTLDLLLGKSRRSPTATAAEVSRRFREVLVDEYQDSNEVQDAIFGALTRQRNNCFMVGDVKQSIYQFRLADPEIFLDKYRSYDDAAQARPGQGRRVLLSRNFRSGGAVLEAANDVFRLCMTQRVGGLDYTEAEALREGVPHIPLGEPETELHIIRAGEDSYGQEAAFVAQRIEQLLHDGHYVRQGQTLRPIVPEDIVILLRSPGSVGQDYLNALSARGIRCAFSGGRNLLETGEISVLRGLLQLISNPRQDIPLLSVLASPVFGFTANDLARLRAGKKEMELYDALCQDASEKAAHFLSVLSQLRTLARGVSLARLLEEIFVTTRLDGIYAMMENGVERSANLQAFFKYVVEFESTSRRDLEQFLEHLDAMEEAGLMVGDPETAGAVTIMSIHKSKGLEFPVVFLAGLARSFNRESLRAQVLCDKTLGLGLSVIDPVSRVRYPTIARRAVAARATEESLSEELRVLYVAMTRAKDRLIMTYVAKNPEKELQSMARQLELCGPAMLAGEVTCPGQWILMEALRRTEAGALFQLAQCRPEQTHSGDYPWLIETHEGLVPEEAREPEEASKEPPDPAQIERLARGLAFRYPHESAVHTPSKQTATQLKGRQKDEEAAQNTRRPPVGRSWRSASSAGKRTASGRDYGNAMHAAMQFLPFSACTEAQSLEAALEELVVGGLLEPEQADLVSREHILALFHSELGQRLLKGQEVVREFKFSILEDAESYAPELRGEQILLQGVVDCALIEQSGITVVDFKTDRVTEQTIAQTVERYRPQVTAYARAMERIFEKPVCQCLLYFFHTDQAVAL